jgi:hypothetical protein
VHTEHDNYVEDINSEASAERRTGFVEDGATPVGYVRDDAQLYTPEGEINWAAVLPEPPTDCAYTPFYGEKYLVHEQWFWKVLPLPIAVAKRLLECCLRIRYNGATLGEFFNVTAALVSGQVGDIEIALDDVKKKYIVRYSLNEEAEIPYRDRMFSAWRYIVAQKFKLFRLVRRDTGDE